MLSSAALGDAEVSVFGSVQAHRLVTFLGALYLFVGVWWLNGRLEALRRESEKLDRNTLKE
ncbi:MAG: hypothetical protein AB7P07_02550 [Hyphomonadaceae bacterium]